MSSRLSARYLVLTLVAIHALWPTLPCGGDAGGNAFSWVCHWDQYQAASRKRFDLAWSPAERCNRVTVAVPTAVTGGG